MQSFFRTESIFGQWTTGKITAQNQYKRGENLLNRHQSSPQLSSEMFQTRVALIAIAILTIALLVTCHEEEKKE